MLEITLCITGLITYLDHTQHISDTPHPPPPTLMRCPMAHCLTGDAVKAPRWLKCSPDVFTFACGEHDVSLQP
jgi:hypothetical protein